MAIRSSGTVTIDAIMKINARNGLRKYYSSTKVTKMAAVDVCPEIATSKSSWTCPSAKMTFGNALVPLRIGAHEAGRCNAQRQ